MENELTEWVKCEFHCHANEDPKDKIRHSAKELIARAAEKGFKFVALTLHEKVYLPEELRQYAATLGIGMAPACELYIEGRDILAINCPSDLPQRIKTLRELAAFKLSAEGQKCFLIPPHPHYILGGSLGHKKLTEFAHCWDAIELCHLRTPWLDLSKLAKDFAEKRGLPTVATSDAHSLGPIGTYYTQVEIPKKDGPPNWDTIAAGIRTKKLKLVRPYIPSKKFISQIISISWSIIHRKVTSKLTSGIKKETTQGCSRLSS